MAKEKIRTSVLFRIYYYQKQSAAGKAEGVIRITDERGKLTDDLPEKHFDKFESIPRLMRELLNQRARTGMTPLPLRLLCAIPIIGSPWRPASLEAL